MWDKIRVNQLVQENLKDRVLVVVSNREPYVHRKSNGKIVLERGGGGLTSILDAAMQATGGIWVAWGSGDADWETADQEGKILVPPNRPAYTLKRVCLSSEQVEHYYHGFSNRFFWPFFHNMMDRVKFLEKEWQYYQEANRRFADAILSEVQGFRSPVIWIQDYHLACVPQMVRAHRPDATISLFWHIPWPSYDHFKTAPCRQSFLESLLGCDLIGFQTPSDRNNFLEAVEGEFGASVNYADHSVTYRNHTTYPKTFAASIDTEKWSQLAGRPGIEEEILNLRSRHGLSPAGFLGIGVDRLEYTKALLERFQAIDLFLENFPQYCGKFTFVQIAPPTRVAMLEYQEYREAVENLIRLINAKYCSQTWQPIVYYPQHVEMEELAVYYRAADLAIVSSFADGMNLVAKEYIASQVDEKGVLLLSQFVGAACEMKEAVLINPRDIEDFSKKIYFALEMFISEKGFRVRSMKNHLKIHNVYKWVGEQLSESCRIGSQQDRQTPICR